MGPVASVIHTAGLSPSMGAADLIMRVNAVGTVNINEAFLPLAHAGFAIVNVSIGGHIGGLIGGILATLTFARWGKGHAAYSRVGIASVVGLVVIAVASVAISYWKVRGLA